MLRFQCWFPLDQRVWMDSQVQFVLDTETLMGLALPLLAQPQHFGLRKMI